MGIRRWLIVGLFVSGMLLSLSEILLTHEVENGWEPVAFAGGAVRGASASYRLVTSMLDLQASVETGGQVTRFGVTGLALTSRRLPSWLHVGPVAAEVPLPEGSAMRRYLNHSGGKAETLCLWSHPPEKGPLVLTWADVPPGILDGYLYFLPSADDKGAISVKVEFNGKPARKFDFNVKHGKSERLRVELDGSVAGPLSVSVEARSKGRNHMCLDGVVEVEP